MGRDYYGDIEGTFESGVQSSFDASNFGIEVDEVKKWGGNCNCYCDEDVIDFKDYCRNCYSSYEEHLEDAEEDEDTLLYFTEYHYNFEKKHKKNIIKVLNEIKNVMKKQSQILYDLLIKYGNCYDGCEDFDEDNYNLSWEEYQVIGDNLVFFARFQLGKNILSCLTKRGSCSFQVEI